MVKLILIRHGAVVEPWPEKPGAVYGCLDVELSDIGKEEAVRAAEKLKEEKIDLIYHSGLKRAIFGAEEVAKYHSSATVERVVEMKEINRGDWVGLTPTEINENNPGMPNIIATDDTFRPPNGENYSDLTNRVIPSLKTLLNKWSDDVTAVLVCHNWVIRCIIAAVQSKPFTSWTTISIPTASITTISFKEQSIESGEIISFGIKP